MCQTIQDFQRVKFHADEMSKEMQCKFEVDISAKIKE